MKMIKKLCKNKKLQLKKLSLYNRNNKKLQRKFQILTILNLIHLDLMNINSKIVIFNFNFR